MNQTLPISFLHFFVMRKSEEVFKKEITITYIEEIVCKRFNIDASGLHTKRQDRKVSEPKHIIMFLTEKFTNLTLKDIAEYFGYTGDSRHSAVINARRAVLNKIYSDKYFKARVFELQAYISGNV